MYADDAISPDGLKQYISTHGGAKSPAAMNAVAENMATLFTLELVKEMRSTTMQDGQDFGQKTYAGMFDMELAKLLAQKETGLRDMLLKQLERLNDKATLEQSGSKSSDSREKTASIPAASGGQGVSGYLPATGAATGGMNEKTIKMIKAAFGSQATNAVAVAFAESSGNPNATHYNAPYGSTDYGLFQINDKFWADRLRKKGIINSTYDLFDPQKNIQAAAWIYKHGGHGGWNQWTSVQSGRAQLGPPDVLEADNSGINTGNPGGGGQTEF